MKFPGEEEAIQRAIAVGAEWGYGNLICRLQEAWGKMLHEKYGVGDGGPHEWPGHASKGHEKEIATLESLCRALGAECKAWRGYHDTIIDGTEDYKCHDDYEVARAATDAHPLAKEYVK